MDHKCFCQARDSFRARKEATDEQSDATEEKAMHGRERGDFLITCSYL